MLLRMLEFRGGVYRRMPTHKEVYEAHAAEYEALVSQEDYEGNILKAIREIVSPDGLDILDLGAGTGRLAGLLAPMARSVIGFRPLDSHAARPHVTSCGSLARSGRWLAAAADHRFLPLRARRRGPHRLGWSVSYVATWYPESWRRQADAWMREAERVLRPGGNIILFESLGTGNDHLSDFRTLRSSTIGWMRTTSPPGGFALTTALTVSNRRSSWLLLSGTR